MFRSGISVECKVGKGTFMSGYNVKIECAAEILWEGAVDKEMVLGLCGTPSVDKFVNGRLYASLINYNQMQALIELPVENPSVGRQICVPIRSVRREKVPA